MTKLIIFDLDGVLIDSKDIHYQSLNKALELVDSKYVITRDEQKKTYEGLPTKLKLKMLTQHKGLPEVLCEEISNSKQVFTKKMLIDIEYDNELIAICNLIKYNGIKIAVASNSIRSTIEQCLTQLGIIEYIDHIVSNEDVKFSKPHPEIYWKTMSYFGCTVEEVAIFEDSIVGKLAATDSKANLIEVKNRKDLNIEKVEKAIKMLKEAKASWKELSLNVLIPMAGAGRRFAEAGYTFPKPLIDVKNKPMIQAVVDNLAIQATYTYIVQKSHFEKYNLGYLLNAITPNCNIVQVDGVTEGAAVTCLLAKEFIDTESSLIVANSDQIVDWNSREFLYEMHSKNADGGIATFKSTHPKWSYVKVNELGLVTEVAEKKPISDDATVGIYYWKHGSDFVKYAEQMIEKNIRVNGEFYTCPVFNEAIRDGKQVYTTIVDKMWGIGTPEDLNYYLLNKQQ
jgi:beta-phosphoglucomutase-like phosphatase (HAD superfamily)/dTDP-glucose pyrophosphorylase